MSHPALTQLRALRYFDQIPALDPQQLDWLLLEDSMTKRFEQQGKTVTVTLIQEGFVSGDEIANELPLLPRIDLDLNANYRFDAWSELEGFNSKVLTLGAVLRLTL